jgi:hypothetical protein
VILIDVKVCNQRKHAMKRFHNAYKNNHNCTFDRDISRLYGFLTILSYNEDIIMQIGSQILYLVSTTSDVTDSSRTYTRRCQKAETPCDVNSLPKTATNEADVRNGELLSAKVQCDSQTGNSLVTNKKEIEKI